MSDQEKAAKARAEARKSARLARLNWCGTWNVCIP